ncbi:hypothetical protein BD289DRAFT_485987, partial [Coniella lustricola]
MDKSPLTQQPRPEAFQQKVVQLYEELFKDDQDAGLDLSEGFWRELFLLKPDRASLRRILDELTPGDLLHFEEQTRELFARAVKTLKKAHAAGAGAGAAQMNALD